MKILTATTVASLLTVTVFAQVDVASRRTLSIQTEEAVSRGSEESLGAVGYFWFNQNNYPWTNTALRVIYAGVFLDAELSYYVAGNTNSAVGLGGGGGAFINSVTPYVNGERLARQSYSGDDVHARVFVNQTIPNPSPLALNLRGTYAISESFYRDNGSTENFNLPPDFFTQTLQAELRFGGVQPGLLSKRGAELYVGADANYRSGFDAFGPDSGPVLGRQSEYERVFSSLTFKLPAGPTVVDARLCGGYGDHLDELSAWKLGGNLVNVGSYAYTLHGYYLHEFCTDRFVMSNLALTVPVNDDHKLAVHFYGDWANARGVPPLEREYHNYFGVGSGVSFRAPWKTDVLLSYGYGINAVRNGGHGGHEVALGLERQF
jgi:hypothetical protein